MRTVPATAEHVKAMYGRPLADTLIGLTGLEGDRCALFGAIYIDQGRTVITFKADEIARENMQRHARTILKGAKHLLAIAEQTKLPVVAVADPAHARSKELLEHLGFRHLEKDTYQWQT